MDSIHVRRWLRRRNPNGGDTTREPGKCTRRPGVEGLEGRQLLAASLPDIAMVSAATRDSQSLTIAYDVIGTALDAPVRFGVYRSADDRLDASDLLIGSRPVLAAGGGTPTLDAAGQPAGDVGRHTISLAPEDGLPPNPERPFVLVVADPENVVAESDEADNTASFRKHVIGVVTHGGVQPADWIYGPAWQLRMGNNLRAEGYDDVIAFNWVSESRDPGAAVKQVPRLLKAILFATSQLPASDPVDLHLIGHSEGTVINSLAALRLRDEAPPSLEAGYLKVTMLDPHAANNAVAGQQYSVSNGLLGWYAKLSIDRYQERAKDPAVLVPDNVDDAEVFYQHTPVSEAQSNGGIYNLWGQVPVHGPARYFDITGPGISHSGTFGVHDWYRLNIVPTLGDGSTFTKTNALTVARAPETVRATDRDANLPAGRRPSFTGTAAPGATVRLIAARIGSTGLMPLGQTVSGPDGNWDLTSRSMAPGRYRVKAVANVPESPTPRLIPTRPIHMRPTAWAEPLVVPPGRFEGEANR